MIFQDTLQREMFSNGGLGESVGKLGAGAQPVEAYTIRDIGAINRTGIEDLGDNDFYGSSYFVDPEGKFVGEVGDAHNPELIVRDLDFELLETVRDRWQFYRDRRPDAYSDLTKP